MATTQASAPGKVILFGEHAVVYGQPAIAVPVSQSRARATVSDSQEPGVVIDLPDLKTVLRLGEADPDDAFVRAVEVVREAGDLHSLPALHILVESDIPSASGMGSGAATATALIRALIEHLDLAHLASAAQVAALTYRVEEIHHGTPSGIDNTVVAYEQPVYFQRRQAGNLIETFTAGRPLHLLIADTGIRSSTREVVGDVRRQWQENAPYFEALFAECGRIAVAARHAIEAGMVDRVGALMVQNQALLQKMTVSCEKLDNLVKVAMLHGAEGAKLSGGGRGGNMIALAEPAHMEELQHVLKRAGARRVLAAIVG